MCLATQFDPVRVGLRRLALLVGAIAGPVLSLVMVACVSSLIRPYLSPYLIRWVDRISGTLMLGFAVPSLS